MNVQTWGPVPPRRRFGVVARLLVAAVAVAVAGVGVLVTRTDAVPGPVPPVSSTTAVVPSTTTSTTSTVPPPPPTVVPSSTPLASPVGEIVSFDAPGGKRVGLVGKWYGFAMTMPIVEDRGEWLRIMMPERPNGLTAWVRADEVTRSVSTWRLVLTLSEFRLRVFNNGVEQWSASVGIGRDRTRTPVGSFFVAVIERDLGGGYGPIVLDLNAHSEDILSWQGSGDAITAFHGPFGSEKVIRAGGGKVSNGCIRMLTSDQLRLEPIPLGTPVDIVE